MLIKLEKINWSVDISSTISSYKSVKESWLIQALFAQMYLVI